MSASEEPQATTSRGEGETMRSETAARINFPLYEKVVQIEKTERVKQAREEHWEADILGLKGPQWNTHVEKQAPGCHKFNVKYSDQKLTNTLQPGLLNEKDSRLLSGTTHIKANNTAYFDRGEVTVGGWEKSTASESAAARRAREEADLQKSLKQTSKVTTKLLGTGGAYIKPTERTARITEKNREAKAKEFEEASALVERYGEEGAELMKNIMKMPKVKNPKGGKASKADVSGVHALPDVGDSDDETTSLPKQEDIPEYQGVVI